MFCQANMKIKMSPLSVHCEINSCEAGNKNALLAFYSVCHVLYRDKTRSLGNKMLSKGKTRHKFRDDH